MDGRKAAASRRTPKWPRLAKLVFRFWGDTRCVSEEFHEAVALGFSRTLLEKVSSRFNDTNFFRDGGSDPLVQRHALLFREALRRFLDGRRKLQWIRSSIHGLTYDWIL